MRIKALVIMVSIYAGLTACSPAIDSAGSAVERAFERRQRDVQVAGEGRVTRILSDDKQGSPHQRFIVRLSSGQTVLIQHNIELAPRIPDISEGDTVSFYGEYVWNEQGGIIHWTHHDPTGRHVGGWVKHDGRTYK